MSDEPTVTLNVIEIHSLDFIARRAQGFGGFLYRDCVVRAVGIDIFNRRLFVSVKTKPTENIRGRVVFLE